MQQPCVLNCSLHAVKSLKGVNLSVILHATLYTGTGSGGQHADSIFASAGLVKADHVGQVDGHQAYYQSHSLFGHEFVDKSHIIVGGTEHGVSTHATSEVASHTPSAADHLTNVAGQETISHSAPGHDTSAHTLSQQVCLLCVLRHCSQCQSCINVLH